MNVIVLLEIISYQKFWLLQEMKDDLCVQYHEYVDSGHASHKFYNSKTKTSTGIHVEVRVPTIQGRLTTRLHQIVTPSW